MMKDISSLIVAFTGGTASIAAIFSGTFDPLLGVAGLAFTALVCFAFSRARWRKLSVEGQTPATSQLTLPDEFLRHQKTLVQNRRNIDRIISSVPLCLVVGLLLIVLLVKGKYIFSPVDHGGFKTVGGLTAHDTETGWPHWYFEARDLSPDAPDRQADLVSVYRSGHGCKFWLTKRPSASIAQVQEINVRVVSRRKLPAVFVPPLGGVEILPYVLVADFPSNAKVGTARRAVFYKRNEKTQVLEEASDAAFPLAANPQLFDIRINCPDDCAMEFAIEVKIASGWRSATVVVGKSQECLFMSQQSVQLARQRTPPPNLFQMQRWLDQNYDEPRETLAKYLKSPSFTPDVFPNTDPNDSTQLPLADAGGIAPPIYGPAPTEP